MLQIPKSIRNPVLTTLSVLASIALAPAADAQWTVTNLHPVGATRSSAQAASGGQQAGYAVVGGVSRASLSSGTAASWVDLNAFVPAGFSSSLATGISNDGVNTYVLGQGYNTLANRFEALLWTRPLPPPPCPADFNGDGFFDYLDFVQAFSIGC